MEFLQVDFEAYTATVRKWKKLSVRACLWEFLNKPGAKQENNPFLKVAFHILPANQNI